jgi:hypothetical protein
MTLTVSTALFNDEIISAKEIKSHAYDPVNYKVNRADGENNKLMSRACRQIIVA